MKEEQTMSKHTEYIAGNPEVIQWTRNGINYAWCDECQKYIDPEWHDHADQGDPYEREEAKWFGE
jgi:hypothetical protein